MTLFCGCSGPERHGEGVTRLCRPRTHPNARTGRTVAAGARTVLFLSISHTGTLPTVSHIWVVVDAKFIDSFQLLSKVLMLSQIDMKNDVLFSLLFTSSFTKVF